VANGDKVLASRSFETSGAMAADLALDKSDV
jgi:hypothetical protein